MQKRAREDVGELYEPKSKRQEIADGGCSSNSDCWLSAKSNVDVSDTDHEPNCLTNVDQQNVERQKEIFLVVSLDKNLRLVRIDLNRQVGYRLLCHPSYVLTAFSQRKASISAVLLVGSDFLRRRLCELATQAGIRFQYENKYADSDDLLLRFCLAMFTQYSLEVIDQFTLLSELPSGDQTMPLSLETVARLHLLPYEYRFLRDSGSTSLADVCCDSFNAKELSKELLCSPPPRDIAANIGNCCLELMKLRTAVPRFDDYPNYAEFVKEFDNGFSNQNLFQEICKQFKKMQVLMTDERYFELIQSLRRVVRHVCSLRAVVECEWSLLAQTLSELPARMRDRRRKFLQRKSDAVIGEQNNDDSTFSEDVRTFVYVWHFLLTFEMLRQHVYFARLRRWTVAHLTDDPRGMNLHSFRPFWLNSIIATENNIELDRPTVLTGCNSSGKSVALSAIAAISLLANCGFLVPCQRAVVPFFDNIFVCGSAHDSFVESKGAQEMLASTVSAVADFVTEKTLVLLDCVVDSTSANVAAQMMSGLLEFFALSKCCTAMIATRSSCVTEYVKNRADYNWKTINVVSRENTLGEFDYKLVDGLCTQSPNALSAFFRFSKNKLLLQCLGERFPQFNRGELRLAPLSNNNLEGILKVFVAQVQFAHRLYGHRCNMPEPIKVLPREKTNGTAGFQHFCYLRRNCESKRVYVGETANINGRIRQHASKQNDALFVFYVMEAANKQIAKHAETFAIRALDRLGVVFDSMYDGKRRIGGEIC